MADYQSTISLQKQGLNSTEKRALTAVLLGVILATLDTAIAKTALPTIAADLHASAATSIWIINAYQLTVVATVVGAVEILRRLRLTLPRPIVVDLCASGLVLEGVYWFVSRSFSFI